MLNHDLKNFIENTHQNGFDTSFFYKRYFFELTSSISEATLNLADTAPTILGCVSSQQNGLDITFILQNVANTIDVPVFDVANASHTDYLWEQHCLELFVSDHHAHYYEINAGLDGKFAVYQFDNYRNPASLPPKKSSDLTFKWQNVQIGSKLLYQFSLLFSQQAHFRAEDIALINPCAILYAENNPIFYAVNHANPPDFHDKAFWSNF